MATLQIELTDAERNGLRSLSEGSGRSEDELIHRALKELLQSEAEISQPDSNLTEEEHLQRMRRAWGMWADRTDLPGDIHEWRKTQERKLLGWP